MGDIYKLYHEGKNYHKYLVGIEPVVVVKQKSLFKLPKTESKSNSKYLHQNAVYKGYLQCADNDHCQNVVGLFFTVVAFDQAYFLF